MATVAETKKRKKKFLEEQGISADEFIRAREKAINVAAGGAAVPGKKAIREGTASTAALFAEQERLERETERIGIAQQAGAATAEELTRDILNPPSLEPEPLSETLKQPAAELGLEVVGGVQDVLTPAILEILQPGLLDFSENAEAFSKTRLGETIGLSVTAAGIGAVGGLIGVAGAAAVTTVAAAKMSAGAALALYFAVSKAWDALASDVIGGRVTDVNRNRINQAMTGIGNVAGQASTTLSAVQNGIPSEDGLANLRRLTDAVNEAERSMKELTIYNLKYKLSKEHVADEAKIVDARANIIERWNAIVNIMATGNAKLNPELLMMDMERLKEFEV
jgi:hypothetical protein